VLALRLCQAVSSTALHNLHARPFLIWNNLFKWRCACVPHVQDIFRRYPNQYETIIAQLCDNLESLDEPEAKASMIWIIGEYAERIDNADELLETFPEETSMVIGVGGAHLTGAATVYSSMQCALP
jgi:hypothetical protein